MSSFSSYIREVGDFPISDYLNYETLNDLLKRSTQSKSERKNFFNMFASELTRVSKFYLAKEEQLLQEYQDCIKSPQDQLSQQLTRLEELATILLKYVAFNRTGFFKLIGKKRFPEHLREKWQTHLQETPFCTSRKMDKLIVDVQKKLTRKSDKERIIMDEESDNLENVPLVPNPNSEQKSRTKKTNTWAFILGTFIQQTADNANKLFVPLILLAMTSTEVMVFLSTLLTVFQSIGALIGGHVCYKYNARSVLCNFVYCRTFLALSLASTYTIYSHNIISLKLCLGLVLLIASIDWTIRGIIDTARNILPMAFSSYDKDRLDKINTQFFAVFELGALTGPLLQGVVLALGLSLDVVGWVPFVGFVLNCIVDFWIPSIDPSLLRGGKKNQRSSFETVEEDQKGFVSFLKRRFSFFTRIAGAIKFLWIKSLFLVFSLILLCQVYRVRTVLPQIIAVELFGEDSYAAWIFCAYAGGNVVGSVLYAFIREKMSASMHLVTGSIGCVLLGISWFPFTENATITLTNVVVGAFLFSIVNMLGRTALQTLLQISLKGEDKGVDVMGLNRFFVTVFAIFLRVIVGFCFLAPIHAAFIYTSGLFVFIGVVTVIGAFLLQRTTERAAHQGILVVFEGLDGAGKSTQVARLKAGFERNRFAITTTAWSKPCLHADYVKYLKREPKMRNVLLTIVQALDFQYLVKREIMKEIEKKKIVICDRYNFTALARGVARGFRIEWLQVLYRVPKEPDLVVYPKIDPKIATERVLFRSGDEELELSEDAQTHKVVVEADDKTKEASAVSVYEAGLDVADPALSVRENFVRFQTRVSREYDHIAMSSTNWLIVDANSSRDNLEKQISEVAFKTLKEKQSCLTKFTGTSFDHSPLEDLPKFWSVVKGRDGFHWYFRRTTMDMRDRLTAMTKLDNVPQVYLHGNAHLQNYAVIDNLGSCMIDFDRALIGPYIWDLVRFFLSVTIKKADAMVEPTLRPGFFRAFKRGYCWGLSHQNEPFKSMTKLSAFDDRQKAEFGKPETFFAKRINIMDRNPIDPHDPQLVAMVQKYAESLGKPNYLKRYEIVKAGAVQNWNGRMRHLVMLKSLEPRQDIRSLGVVLVDIKPCCDDPDKKFFKNPFPNSQAMRMLTASKIYAPNFYCAQSGFVWEGKEHLGRKVPLVNLKLKTKITVEEYKDLMFSVGTQLGVAHAKSYKGDPEDIRRHFLKNLDHVCGLVERLRDEVSGAYQRYIYEVKKMEEL